MSMDDVQNYDGVRIIVFFLNTCGHCINQIEVLKDIDVDYDVEIFELNARMDTTNQSLINFKADHSIPETWIMGFSTDESENQFDVGGVPTSVVLDDLGRIVSVLAGYTGYGTFASKIEDAINHRTENYSTEYESDPFQDLKALFIIIGVGVGVVAIYFLVKSFISRKKV